MPKPLELRKVIRRLRDYGVIYVTGRGRHPKFYDPETKKSYPVKSHGKKTLILHTQRSASLYVLFLTERVRESGKAALRFLAGRTIAPLFD